MPASDAFKSFESLGHERFQKMADEQNPPVGEPVLESRATTIRLPSFKLDALDTVAREIGLTRQDFLGLLIESALGDAICGFSHGFGENFLDYHPEQHALEWLGKLDHTSPASRAYLFATLEQSLGLNGEHHA
jgi:hypothetical protein